MAAEWLGKELQSRIMARVDKSFLESDPDSCPVDERAGVLCPGRATTVLREAFQQADAELLAYIESEWVMAMQGGTSIPQHSTVQMQQHRCQ